MLILKPYKLIFLATLTLAFVSCDKNIIEPSNLEDIGFSGLNQTNSIGQIQKISSCIYMNWHEATTQLNNYDNRLCQNMVASSNTLYFNELIWISDYDSDCFNIQMLYFSSIVFAMQNAPQGGFLSPFKVNKIDFVATVITGIPGAYAILIESVEYIVPVGIIRDGVDDPCDPTPLV